jgi:hypothetical protein
MERLIALEGCLNFRDLGGYPIAGGRRVRWRRMFRSDSLCGLTPADVRRLRDEIGLATVVDLAPSAEPGRRRSPAAARAHRAPSPAAFDGESIRAEDRDASSPSLLAARRVREGEDVGC